MRCENYELLRQCLKAIDMADDRWAEAEANESQDRDDMQTLFSWELENLVLQVEQVLDDEENNLE